MKIFEINNDSHYYTFETTWIGLETFDFEKENLSIPLINIYVKDQQVINYIDIDVDGLYIEKSYFLFKKVLKMEKKIAIHSKNKNSFITKNFKEKIKIGNIKEKVNVFELSGMGVFQDYTYDGVLKIYCDECYFVLPNNFEHRIDFKSMNEYNPLEESWLTNFDLYLKKNVE